MSNSDSAPHDGDCDHQMPPPPPPPLPPPPPPPSGFGLHLIDGWPVRRTSSKARRGDVRAAILLLLAEAPRNGYQLIQEIVERTDRLWKPSPGSVYPALAQLEDEEIVFQQSESGRKAFHLTDKGREYVRTHGAELGDPWAAVTDSASEPTLALRDTLAQVCFATVQVAQAGTGTHIAQARQLLATARQDLYRILAQD